MDYVIETLENRRYITFPRLTALGLGNVFSTSDMDFRLRENSSQNTIFHDYQLLKSVIGGKNKLMFSSNQVHDCHIIKVHRPNQGEAYTYGRTLPPVDGLLTNQEDFILKTTYADCTPILIFDPVTKCHANLHSGWRGTTKKIGALGVARMKEEYGAKPENMIALIGPSIGKDSFEVEENVVELFQNTFDFAPQVIRKKNELKYLIDLKTTNKIILETAGLLPENIVVCPLDTYNNPLFHSHRYHGDNSGRMIMLSTLV